MAVVIDVKGLTKHFGKVKAVDGISFQVQGGEIFGFLGPNGAGKTTTIRCMMDFIRPSGGSLSMFGLDARNDSVKLKQKIGYLSADVRLHDGWTGEDHINFVARLRKGDDGAHELIKKLNFNPRVKAKALSSGNKQKLAIILALIGKPELLILDEPTRGLDPILQRTIEELLRAHAVKGGTVFMSSHNLAEVEHLCSRVGIIRAGKILAVESLDALQRKHIRVITVRFVGPYERKDFELENVEVTEWRSDGFTCKVAGELVPLMKSVGKYSVKDIEASHAALEDVFLAFYE